MDINYYKQFEPIDGKWYLKRELGSGAFGKVFEVERNDFSTMRAAMKIVSIPSSQTEIENFMTENYDLDEKSVTSYFYGFVEEFVKEFQLMAMLKGHSNIVSYEDHDVKPKTEGIGWDIFIRMELLTPMNEFFKNNLPTQTDVVKLGIDICKALEVCQKYKIIHRDIKPSNIFVSETGEYKLGDFGVARTLEKTSSGLSKKGTYVYMAPEVYRGEKYGSNVDIYSLGIVMYKLLNNNLEPYRKDRTYADSERALELRMSGAKLESPANAENELAAIVLKACSFNPKDRYENPTQMREQLENIAYSEKMQEKTDRKKNVDEHGNNENSLTYDNKIASSMDEEEKTTGMFNEVKQESIETKSHRLEEKSNDSYADVESMVHIRNEQSEESLFDFNEIKGYYINFWKRIFDFKGVTGRKEFWILTFVNIITIYIANFISCLPLVPLIIAAWIIFIGCLIGGISLCTRRLHDVGKSGKLQWLYLTIIGIVIVLVFLCKKSKIEDNKYT